MRYPILFLLIALTVQALPAQRIQMYDLKFSDQILEELKAGKLHEASAAYLFTYIGKYREALDQYEVPLAWGLDAMSAAEKADFQQYRPVNAYRYLEQRTKDEELVIISEAHHKIQHRVFTRNMLATLYGNGFRYLGIEALNTSIEDPENLLLDTELQQRGYPLNGPVSGTYTREPQMSNMIREAIAMGFEVFGYERATSGEERDVQQAKNILQFMEDHPDGKVVIHCGWYHAIESNYPKREDTYYMAHLIKQLSDIDPLTIYQDALSERFLDAESPYYKMVKAEDVSVLINGSGEVFNGKPGEDHFDIMVYHPRTKYRKNRPDWLYHLPDHTFVKVKSELLEKDQFPVLVKAYPVGEVPEAMPMDIIELSTPNDNTYLVLKKGKYRVEMVDRAGEVVEYDLEFN
ncbi:hypothetical protein [Flavilitoribacter nigricans]|uniref:Uncharacterized protein n=1 Tax=Flavilitoribacter nigricans (strain ATCC 23147 / DSM 23189 / NBRC 102662 / NCIMB 1420 / SS-2) TaxID=1122177 RepID=A0A2D0N5Q2_FLAN2|nr:hypothetical protein [Flavilitoribacter nigricans]PHN03489.1 hypothetical protein CRP01_26160 [Flavilitoribacter nigricans DSM 23189 = NBRC 102662]